MLDEDLKCIVFNQTFSFYCKCAWCVKMNGYRQHLVNEFILFMDAL